ncbi:MAG: hypothetical protein D6768_20280 [Chloroflexi bacterium]|nr:MAG: hypothetical protein D6768_20280 [Chloroflexota bacterium]
MNYGPHRPTVNHLTRTKWHTTAIVFVGFSLQVWGLARQSLWFDEAFSATVAGVGWPVFWTALLVDGVHPPGYYLLLRGWLALTGPGEFALRFPSVAAATVSIPLIFQIGRQLHSRRLGLAAAALLAVNPFAWWYAQEARMYSLLLCLTLFSGYAFWQLTRRPGPKWTALLAGASAAGFLIHYFLLAFSLVQFVYLLVTLKANHRVLRWWAASQAAAIVPFLPWAWAVARREGGGFGINWIPPVTVADLPLTLANLAFAAHRPDWPVTWASVLLVGGAVALGVSAVRRSFGAQSKATGPFLWWVGLWLALPLLLVWFFSLRQPLYVDRYFILSLPALLLLLACVRLLPKRRGNLALSILLLASGAGLLRMHIEPEFTKEDWRAAARTVQAAEQPGDALIVRSVQSSIAFGYYYRGVLTPQTGSVNEQTFPPESLIGDSRRVWLVYRRPFRPTHAFAGSAPFSWRDVDDPVLGPWLNAHRNYLADEITLPGVYVTRYQLPAR